MAWLKGKGKYPKNWDKIKAQVMHRDNYRCVICGRIPDNFKKNYNPNAWDNITTQHFRVHHRDLNKSNNDLSNLMYVCQWCHGELHRDLNEGYIS